MSKEFKTSDGWLTPYALACGYIESFRSDDGKWITLSLEHSVYTVACFDHANNKSVMREQFHTLTPARNCYRKQAAILRKSQRKSTP